MMKREHHAGSYLNRVLEGSDGALTYGQLSLTRLSSRRASTRQQVSAGDEKVRGVIEILQHKKTDR
jgi:hypothetical protein